MKDKRQATINKRQEVRSQKTKLFSCFLLLASFLLPLASCSNAEFEYSTIPCYFVFNNALRNNATLATAMNPMSPGIFVAVSREGVNPTYYVFRNNHGQCDSTIVNAIDDHTTIILGMQNGLILGYGNLDNPAPFFAYDRECPNCSHPDDLPLRSHPLTMKTDGTATCATCHRRYNMNTGGNIIEGEHGQQLIRYRCNQPQPYGVVTVN